MIHVLLVDDEKGIRTTLSEFLQTAGYRVSTAPDSVEALSLLKAGDVDVVVSDIMLPRLSGLELLRAIRQVAPDVQVVMITGAPSLETATEALRAGAGDYISKPVTKEGILRIVANAARVKALNDDRRRLEEENRDYQVHLEQMVEERTRELRVNRDELRAAQMRYLAVIRSTPHGLCLLSPEWTIEYANTAMSTLFVANPTSEETSARSLLQLDFGAFFPEPTLYDVFRDAVVATEDKSRTQTHDMQLRRLDGSRLWCEISIVRHDPSQPLSGYVATLTDISERKATLEALRLSEERYVLAARATNDGLWDWDIARDRMFYAPRWKEMLGHAPEEVGQSPTEWLERIHPEDRELVKAALKAYLTGRVETFQIEHRIRHKNGDYRWVQCRGKAVRNKQDQAIRLVGSLTDITEAKKNEEQLLHRAWHDELTGLANRSSLLHRLDHRLSRAQRAEDYRFALLFLDLDRFKTINESLGHSAGDLLLKEIGRRLAAYFRPSDTVARLGGDEFAILLDELGDEADAALVAGRLRDLLAPPIEILGHTVRVTASMGIVLGSAQYRRPETLLRDADAAMYRAKDKGRDQHVLFDAAIHVQAVDKLELDHDFHEALQTGQFVPYYQPIVSMLDRRVVGFEVLVRWNHPRRGLLSPGEFIPFAEESGLIVPLDRHILEVAALQLCEWERLRGDVKPLELHVNFSARHFNRRAIVANIEEILASTEFPPGCLHLEITETLLLDNPEVVVPILEDIQRLGVRFSIDDFGTGYSSLDYLHRFPLSCLKIDRTFVARLEKEARCLSIVRSILALAENLGLEVIAEGVEEESQVERLVELGCEFAQGYLFSRPLPAAEAEKKFAGVPQL